MSDSGTTFGTVFHPAADPVLPDGRGSTATPTLGRLPGLPRRRRPGMVFLGIALIGAGILGSTALYHVSDHQRPVVIVTTAIPAGAVIAAGDLSTVPVAAGPGVQLISAAQLGQVVGHVAAADLEPGALLMPADLTTVQPPGPGQVLVPVPAHLSDLPISGLAAGDHVLVVATQGAGGTGGPGSGTPALSRQVPAVVYAVSAGANSDNFVVVDLLLPSGDGQDVANLVSTGQFALIVTSRVP